MFATPVAKPKTKSAESQRATVVPHGPSQSAVEQAHVLQRSIGNQAMLRHLARRASANETGAQEDEADAAREAAPGVAWDFSKIPVFAPGESNQSRMRSVLTAPQFPGRIKAKLAIGRVDDPLKHEANRVADQVMRMPAPEVSVAAAPPQVSRKCDTCEEEEKLQQKPARPQATAGEAPAIVHEVLRSPGEPLDAATRDFFEPRFGHDFSHVRVHADEHASTSAKAVGALAYTVGSDIVFGVGDWSPLSDGGRRLLADELTHVIQQGESQPSTSVQRESDDRGLDAPSPATTTTDVTSRLLTVIRGVESAYAAAQQDLSSGEADPQVQEHVQTLGSTLEQMRAVVAGDDEALKQQVLAGFTAQQFEQADAQAKEAAPSVPITQQSPTSLAMKSLHVSSPRDNAEVEADRVADLIMSGVKSPPIVAGSQGLTHGRMINCQGGEAAVEWGTTILVGDAEIAPETGPPGWVIGGVVALAALAVIGVGLLMSSAGNVADTGIMAEARALITAGQASDICAALAILMAGTSDSARKLKIKATQKAMGCRHSRFS